MYFFVVLNREVCMNQQTEGSQCSHGTTLVLSDLHLGDLLCRAKLLLDFLGTRQFSTLILNGDIFADSEIVWRDLPASHKKVLIKIGALIRHGVCVIWIAGNHDEDIHEVLRRCSFFMEVSPSDFSVHKDSYSWMHGILPCVAVHGHQWNPLDQFNGWFTHLILWMFDILKRIDIVTGWRLTRCVSRNAFFWKRSNALVQKGGLNFAQENAKKIVFCGHTHDRMVVRVNDVIYVNTGCWTDRLPTAVMLTQTDVVLYVYSWKRRWIIRNHMPF